MEALKKEVTKVIANLKKVDETELVVTKVNVSNGAKAWENFTCVVEAITVEAVLLKDHQKEETFHFIRKTRPQSEAMARFATDAKLFEAEACFYKQLLPRMQRASDTGLTWPPKALYIAQDVIYFENLRSKGFETPSDLDNLTLQQLQTVLREVAKLHAVSHSGVSMDDFKSDNYVRNMDTDRFKKHQRNQKMRRKVLAQIVEEEDCRRALAEKIRSSIDVQCARLKQIHSHDGFLRCFIHNDLWAGNFMFDHTDTKVKILDFQMSRVGNATIDLVYLIWSCSTPSFRRMHGQDLLSFYHRHLTHDLMTLGLDTCHVKLESLLEDFQRCSTFGFEVAVRNTLANLKRAVGQRTDLIAFAPVKVKQVLVELAEEADSLGLFQLS